jgi:predicted permease
MLIAAALSELLLMRKGDELFFHATRFAVWVGSLGALAAAALGWFFAGFRIADEEWLMTTHRWLGTSASALALVVLFLCERAYRSSERQAFRLALFPLAAVVAMTGFFGGALLYGIDHYAW